VKPNSRRWHHSIGNALWHTVSRTYLGQQPRPISLSLTSYLGFLIPSAAIQILHPSLPRENRRSKYVDAFRRHSIGIRGSTRRREGRVGRLDRGTRVSSFPFCQRNGTDVFVCSLWHSRKLASPIIYGQPTARELALKPPAHYKLVQVAPDGRKTLFLAAHAKTIVGRSFEDSQKLIWKLIDHCTQPKVSAL
jgi:alpha-ketoglutarate-dependent 2,4-dichlorophenoxyacetate dioxygenase